MPKDKTAREILTKLIPEDIRDNPYAKDMVDQALLALKELVKIWMKDNEGKIWNCPEDAINQLAEELFVGGR